MSKVLIWFGVIVLLFGGIAAYELRYFSSGVFNQAALPTETLRPLTIGGTTIYVKIADTPALQEHGLSDTASLPPDQGMLFVFPRSGIYAFWMKDMHYSLDMIWMDDNGKVIYIAPNVSPDTYPAQTFSSDKPAKYVLEVNAGFAAQHTVRIGDVAQF